MTAALPLGDPAWTREQVTTWERCHFCPRFILAGEWHYVGVATQGFKYVTHACERCHLRVYGPLAAEQEQEQEREQAEGQEQEWGESA